jgi:antitoxin component YwqK of YwqJK toxin-antitoxin module
MNKNIFFIKDIQELKIGDIEQAIQLIPLFVVKDDGTMKHIYYYRQKMKNNFMMYYYQDYIGIKEGTALCYYENGALYFEMTLVNDLIHGKCTYYYPNGNKYIVANYKNGDLHGIFYEYYYNGQLLFQEEYKDSKLDGILYKWSYDGKKRKELFFENDLLKNEKEYINNILVSNKNISQEESDEYHRIAKLNTKEACEKGRFFIKIKNDNTKRFYKKTNNMKNISINKKIKK